MRQTALITMTLLVTAIISLPTLAAWKLDNSSSDLTFISVKKGTIAENHHFSTLMGDIDDQAKVNVSVDLNSVHTNIAIRDERLKQHVFETNKYNAASFTAQLDKSMLAALNVGDNKQLKVNGKIDFHGLQQDVSLELSVSRLSDNKIRVNTIKPFFIKADAFGVVAGITKLKELAALPSIDYVVPVSFSVTFTR